MYDIYVYFYKEKTFNNVKRRIQGCSIMYGNKENQTESSMCD